MAGRMIMAVYEVHQVRALALGAFVGLRTVVIRSTRPDVLKPAGRRDRLRSLVGGRPETASAGLTSSRWYMAVVI